MSNYVFSSCDTSPLSPLLPHRLPPFRLALIYPPPLHFLLVLLCLPAPSFSCISFFFILLLSPIHLPLFLLILPTYSSFVAFPFILLLHSSFSSSSLFCRQLVLDLRIIILSLVPHPAFVLSAAFISVLPPSMSFLPHRSFFFSFAAPILPCPPASDYFLSSPIPHPPSPSVL